MFRAWSIACPFLAAIAYGQDLADEAPPSAPRDGLVAELLERVARLEAERAARAQGDRAPGSVDLSEDEVSQLDGPDFDHVLARPWYENFSISGYGAATYLDTGAPGTAAYGSFVVKEASLFFEAEAWKDVYVFSELWLTRYPGGGMRVNELNLQLTDLFAAEDGRGFGMKLGRFELPFGEEYFRWDAHETPFISFSAADPYGVDEGVQLYGESFGVNWIAAATNGSDNTGADDGVSKMFIGKLYADVHPDVYVSASALATGDTRSSAFRLSGNALAPVGTGGASAAGASPSDSIESTAWELDLRLFQRRSASLALGYGQADLDDVEPFDRALAWWQVMPRVALTSDVDLILRWSGIRTDDSDEGYRFAGRPIAMGEALGYDSHSLQRLSAAVCWTASSRLAVKFEVGQDWIDVIDISALEDASDERLYFGFELVASF